MSLPCDDVHWHWGPAVTGAIARSLSQEGWGGTKIAGALGLTPAAVSYYLKYKRGTQPLPPSAMESCMKLCAKILKGDIEGEYISFEMARIAVIARHEGQPAKQKAMLSVCRACMSPMLAKRKK